MQKQLLYRTCILPIAMYGFNLWFFKGAPIVKNVNKLKKCNARQLFGLLVPFKHLFLMALKLLQASYPSLSTCANSMAGITSDTAPSHPRMQLTCYWIHNMQKITLHTKLRPPNSPTNSNLTLKVLSRMSTNVSMVLEIVIICFFLFFLWVQEQSIIFLVDLVFTLLLFHPMKISSITSGTLIKPSGLLRYHLTTLPSQQIEA